MCYPKASRRWESAAGRSRLTKAWETAENHVFPLLSPCHLSSRGNLLLPLQPRLKLTFPLIPSTFGDGKGRSAGLCTPEEFIYSPLSRQRGAGEGCTARLGQLPPLLLSPRPLPSYSMRPSWEMCLLPTPRVSVAETSRVLGQQGLLPAGLYCPLCPIPARDALPPLEPQICHSRGITAACEELLCLYLTGITLSLFL